MNRVAAVCACCVALGTCDLVTMSVFPPYFSHIEREEDLSDHFPGDGWQFILQALTDGNHEIVVLGGWREGDPGSNTAVFLNDDGRFIRTKRDPDLGKLMMIDGAGYLVVGLWRFNLQVSGLPDVDVGVVAQPDGMGYSRFWGADTNHVFTILGPNDWLQCTAYDVGWGSPVTFDPVIRSFGDLFDLLAAQLVLNVELPSASKAVVALRDRRSWTSAAVIFNADSVGAGLNDPFLPDGVDPDYPAFGLGRIRSRISTCSDGIVVRDEGEDSMRIIAWDGREKAGVDRFFPNENFIDTYSNEGDRMYFFDPDRKVLYTGPTWW